MSTTEQLVDMMLTDASVINFVSEERCADRDRTELATGCGDVHGRKDEASTLT